MPYVRECYKELSDLLEYPASNVRTSAITAVGNFCIAMGQRVQENSTLETQQGLCSHLIVHILLYKLKCQHI